MIVGGRAAPGRGANRSHSTRQPDTSGSNPAGAAISSSAPTSTAMTAPISGLAIITSIGRLFTSPPSTCRSLPSRIGGRMPGSEMLARSAGATGPRSCTACAARERLVEMQRYGSGRSSIASAPKASSSRPRMRRPASSDTSGSVGSFSAWKCARQRPSASSGANALRDERGDDRADAGAAHPVDRHAGFGERAQHAQVREAARPAPAEHEPDRLACEAAREPREIRGRVHRHVVMRVEFEPVEEPPGAYRQRGAHRTEKTMLARGACDPGARPAR